MLVPMLSICQIVTLIACIVAVVCSLNSRSVEAFCFIKGRSPPQFVVVSAYLSGEKKEAGRSTQQTVSQTDNVVGNDDSSPSFLFPERLNVIYDSKCWVCQWEVDNLTHLMSMLPPNERQNDLIRFTDLESSYDESDPANGGVTYKMGMQSFHAVRPDGTNLQGVSVLKEAYDIVNYGWVWGWTDSSSNDSSQLVSRLADWGYKLFAKIRTSITRGAKVEDLIEKHYLEKQQQEAEECEACKEQNQQRGESCATGPDDERTT